MANTVTVRATSSTISTYGNLPEVYAQVRFGTRRFIDTHSPYATTGNARRWKDALPLIVTGWLNATDCGRYGAQCQRRHVPHQRRGRVGVWRRLAAVRVPARRASQRAPLPAWVREVRAAVRALLRSEVVDA